MFFIFHSLIVYEQAIELTNQALNHNASENIGQNSSAWISSFLAAVGGYFLSAVLNWYYARKISVEKNSFDFHQELNSDYMLKARLDAWNVLRENQYITYEDIRVTKTLADRSGPIWKVMYLFHRIAAAWNRRYIDAKLAKELYGELFVWWYVMLFNNLGSDWAGYQTVEDLYKSLQSDASNDSVFKKRWDYWHKLAEEDVTKRAAGPDKNRQPSEAPLS